MGVGILSFFLKSSLASFKCSYPYWFLREILSLDLINKNNLKVSAGASSLLRCSLKGVFATNFHNFLILLTKIRLSTKGRVQGNIETLYFKQKHVYRRTNHLEKKTPTLLNWVGPLGFMNEKKSWFSIITKHIIVLHLCLDLTSI